MLNILRRIICSAVLLGSAVLYDAPPLLAAEPTIVIGTGPVAGTYFPAGGAICNVYNRAYDGQGTRCVVQSTGGSLENLERLTRGEIDFALIQSDWQYLALHGGDIELGDKARDLRAVFSLQAHTITILAHPEAGIETLEDLKGRKVNLGPPGSGMRAAAEAVVGALGWSRDDLGEVAELGMGEIAKALCAGQLDAVVLPVSHPNGTVAAAAAMCGARFLSVPELVIARLSADWPFYAPAQIPAGLYAGQDQAVRSYGVRATLVTLATASDDTVFALTRAVFTNIQALAGQHPALSYLARDEMIEAGIVAEIHQGAAQFYRELPRN